MHDAEFLALRVVVQVRELAGFDVLCLLGAIQTGRGHSHFSHLKSGKEIVMTEYGEWPVGESDSLRLFGVARSFLPQCTESLDMTGGGPAHDTVSHEMSLHRFRRRHIATSHVMTRCDIAWTENCVNQASSLLLASLCVKTQATWRCHLFFLRRAMHAQHIELSSEHHSE